MTKYFSINKVKGEENTSMSFIKANSEFILRSDANFSVRCVESSVPDTLTKRV